MKTILIITEEEKSRAKAHVEKECVDPDLVTAENILNNNEIKRKNENTKGEDRE